MQTKGMKNMYIKIVNLFGLEAFVSLINFINIIVITRFLDIQDFAMWGVLVVLLRIGEVLARPKTDLATVYLSGTEKWHITNILFHSLILSLIVGIFVGSIIFFSQSILELFLFSQYQNYDKAFIELIIGILLLSNIFINYKYIFLAKQQPIKYGLVEMIRSSLVLVIIIIFIVNDSLNIYNILWANIFANITAIIASMIIYHSKEEFSFLSQRNLYREIISKGAQFYLIGIFSQINLSLPILLASRFFVPEITGLLIVSKNFIELILTRFISPFSNIAYSSLSHEGNLKIRVSAAIDLAGKCLFLIGISSVILFFIGDKLIVLFYGEKFLDDSILWIIRILLPGVMIFFYSFVLTQYNYSLGLFSKLKYAFLSSILLQLICALIAFKNLDIFLLTSIYSIAISLSGFLMIWYFTSLANINITSLSNMTLVSIRGVLSYLSDFFSTLRSKKDVKK